MYVYILKVTQVEEFMKTPMKDSEGQKFSGSIIH